MYRIFIDITCGGLHDSIEMGAAMNSDVVLSGLELMLLGMGIVFIFLLILIFTMKVMYFISLFFSKGGILEKQKNNQKIRLEDESSDLDEEIVAAITAAVSRFRSQN